MKKATPKNLNGTQNGKPLTKKEEAFCYAWVRLSAEGRENKGEAAQMAGYMGRPSTLSTQGTTILAKPKAQALIKELRAAATALAPIRKFRYIMGVNEILAMTTFLARATLDDVLDEEGRFDIKKARETGGIHALKRIKHRISRYHLKDGTFRETITHEVELRDRNGSLELMGRQFQLWDDGEDPDAEARRLLEEEAEERRRLATQCDRKKRRNC